MIRVPKNGFALYGLATILITIFTVTFNRKTINLYLNGKLDSSVPVQGVPYYSTNGLLQTLPVGELSSDSSLVIGAYHDSIPGLTFQQFSGLICDLRMYNLSLDPPSVEEIYHKNILSTRT